MQLCRKLNIVAIAWLSFCVTGVFSLENMSGIIIGCSVGGSVVAALLILLAYYVCTELNKRKANTKRKNRPPLLASDGRSYSIDRRVMHPSYPEAKPVTPNKFPNMHEHQSRIWMTGSSLSRDQPFPSYGIINKGYSFTAGAAYDRLSDRSRAFSDPLMYKDPASRKSFQTDNPLFLPDDAKAKVYSVDRGYIDVEVNKVWSENASEKSDSGIARSNKSFQTKSNDFGIRVASELMNDPTYSTINDIDLPEIEITKTDKTASHNEPHLQSKFEKRSADSNAVYGVPNFYKKRQAPPLPPRNDQDVTDGPKNHDNGDDVTVQRERLEPRQRVPSTNSAHEFLIRGKEITSDAFQFLEDYSDREDNNTIVSEVVVHRTDSMSSKASR